MRWTFAAILIFMMGSCVELAKDREEVAFRVLNKAGVAGPEYKMSFVSK